MAIVSMRSSEREVAAEVPAGNRHLLGGRHSRIEMRLLSETRSVFEYL